MAKTRKIGNVVTFTPPGFWTGIGQLADVWGNSFADVYPPRLKRVTRARSKKAAVSETSSIKSALRGDVRKIGGDLDRSIEKYAAKKGLKDARIDD